VPASQLFTAVFDLSPAVVVDALRTRTRMRVAIAITHGGRTEIDHTKRFLRPLDQPRQLELPSIARCGLFTSVGVARSVTARTHWEERSVWSLLIGASEENTMKTIDKDALANAQGGWYGYGGYGRAFAGYGNPYWAAARAANYAARASYWNNQNAYLPLAFAAASGAFAPRPATTVIYT
jgi:hypothetical protein